LKAAFIFSVQKILRNFLPFDRREETNVSFVGFNQQIYYFITQQ